MTKNNNNIRFYYIKENRGDFDNPGLHSIACVCLIRDEETGKYCRGVSVCSPREKCFRKVVGRGIAYSYAVHALRTKESTGYSFTANTYSAYHHAVSYYGFPDTGKIMKSEYDAKLTPFEEKVWND